MCLGSCCSTDTGWQQRQQRPFPWEESAAWQSIIAHLEDTCSSSQTPTNISAPCPDRKLWGQQAEQPWAITRSVSLCSAVLPQPWGCLLLLLPAPAAEDTDHSYSMARVNCPACTPRSCHWKRLSAATFRGEMRFLKYPRSKALKLPLNRWQTSKFTQPSGCTNGIVEQVTYREVFLVGKSLLVLPSTTQKSFLTCKTTQGEPPDYIGGCGKQPVWKSLC